MSADRDALAEVLAGWYLEVVGQVSPNDALSIAEGILASDWLAERDARIAAEARKAALEEAALAIEAKRGLLHEALAEVKRGYSNAARIVRSLGGES